MPITKQLRDFAAVHDAIPVSNLAAVKTAPKNRKVAFETQNFGWLLSEEDPDTNRRKILRQE